MENSKRKESINKIKELTVMNNFGFYLNTDGDISLSRYNENNVKLPDIYIEQRSKPELTKIMIDGMSETHPQINSLLEMMTEVNPVFRKAIVKLDNNPKINVEDFLVKNKEIKDLPDFLYHGTSLEAYNNIIHEGLLPRDLSKSEATYKSLHSGESIPNQVYLCTEGNIGSAKFASEQASRNSSTERVIIKIDTSKLDRKLFVADEDSGKQNWKDSLNSLGSVAYAGSIPAEAISKDLSFFPENVNKKKSLKR